LELINVALRAESSLHQSYEGGEGDDIKNHDTYLIFDPEKAKINQEYKIL